VGTDVTLVTVLLVAAVLIGIGVWGALAQQTFVMIMMGIELMVNGAILAAGGFWAFTGGGAPKGQVLVIVAMAVMAVEMAIGFALVVAVYRARQADMTEGISSMKG
jgi:NAD(P)H-quinone oxidoreductase subunit 4L